MHVKFLVRCSVAVPGRMGPAARDPDSVGAPYTRRGGPAALCLPTAPQAQAAQVPVPARAAGRGGPPARQGGREDPHCRSFLPAAVLRTPETQQERPGGPEPSGLVQESAEASSRRHGDRADHYKRLSARSLDILEEQIRVWKFRAEVARGLNRCWMAVICV